MEDVLSEPYPGVPRNAMVGPVLRHLISDCYETALDKGWWDEERSFGDAIALMHSELSEALEEFREGHSYREIYYVDDAQGIPKPEGIPVELADVMIRIFDFCGRKDMVDALSEALSRKMEYNETRPRRHGGKVI